MEAEEEGDNDMTDVDSAHEDAKNAVLSQMASIRDSRVEMEARMDTLIDHAEALGASEAEIAAASGE